MGIDDWRAARDRDRTAREAKWAQQKAAAGQKIDPLDRIARDVNSIKNILILFVILAVVGAVALLMQSPR
jgi:hypothetical protein